MLGLFREAVLASWAADHADLKLGRALIRAIHARRLLAPVADERVLLHFHDGCAALGASLFTPAAHLPLTCGRRITPIPSLRELGQVRQASARRCLTSFADHIAFYKQLKMITIVEQVTG